jgi:hypothetical protein
LDQDMRSVSGKLILPPPLEQSRAAVPLQHSQGGQWHPSAVLLKIGAGLKRADWFTNRVVQFGRRVRRDPAYAFLVVSLVVVLVASVFFTSFAWSMVSRALATGYNAGTRQSGPGQTNVTGTVDFKPAFPAPGGGKGTDKSSLPPFSAPVTFPPEESPTARPSPGSGDGVVQIISIPNSVTNNSTVQVIVQTSQPGMIVYLSVVYETLPPSASTTQSRITDGNGQAVISWRVRIVFSRATLVPAQVTAIAIDPNGGRSMSQSVTVTVTLR